MRPDASEAIHEFWSWWAANRTLLASEVGSVADATFITPLNERVSAIHPKLDWEFGHGERTAHHFCISSVGDPRVRVIAEQWRAAQPEADDLFEYHCARQRIPDPSGVVIGFGEGEFDFAQLRFAVTADEQRQRLDLVMHHPAFADVDEDQRGPLMFIAIDNVLGEDAVETWIGGLEYSADPAPEDAIDVEQLRVVFDAAPKQWTEAQWGVLQGKHPETEQPMVLVANTSAKYLHAPMFDTLCLVRLPFEANEAGMPVDRDYGVHLGTFDERVEAELGDAARIQARETGGGLRTIWCYLRAENGPERTALEGIAAEFKGAELHFQWDPGWREMPI